MELRELLADLFGRVAEHVRDVTAGLDAAELLEAPEQGSNPIGWLVWHLTRVQDMHITEILETDQVWVTGDWGPRFGVASEPWNVGFGHTPAQVAEIRPDSVVALHDYFDAVSVRVTEVLDATTLADLDRIVDRRWDPPVSLGVRLVSIADDSIQHAGQAAYVKGLLQRRNGS
jgi:hypothetical protein